MLDAITGKLAKTNYKGLCKTRWIYRERNYESSFVSMTQALDGKTTYQLYKNYLDNFRINAGRNSR